MDVAQVTQALEALSLGAAAIRAAALAGRPGVTFPVEFTRNASKLRLDHLAQLLGVQRLVAPTQGPELQEKVVRRRVRPPRTRTPRAAKVNPTQALVDFAESASPWDPDAPLDAVDQQHEAGSCRALLLEIIRRASFDWVLYRNSSKLVMKALAEEAHHWLFLEDEGSQSWVFRARTGKGLLAFLTICDTLDLEPKTVRARVRELTERDIMGAGRPAERRKARHGDEPMSGDEHPVFDVDVDSLPSYDPMYWAENATKNDHTWGTGE